MWVIFQGIPLGRGTPSTPTPATSFPGWCEVKADVPGPLRHLISSPFRSPRCQLCLQWPRQIKKTETVTPAHTYGLNHGSAFLPPGGHSGTFQKV